MKVQLEEKKFKGMELTWPFNLCLEGVEQIRRI